jgi:enoyl-CoA hydratase
MISFAENRKPKTENPEPSVLAIRRSGLLSLVLNRPRVINTINLEVVQLLRQALDGALTDEAVRLVLISGAGDRGFCAGGDLKELAQAVRGDLSRADAFFREEYALDLLVHRYPKPVAVFADGVTMGGGLGLAAGADLTVATERTRLAMPETRIGFFPDVGATGWLFAKCPPGYPEYLALTGYELTGAECVRLGLATHLVPSNRLPELRAAWAAAAGKLSSDKTAAVAQLRVLSEPLAEKNLPRRPDLDAWVAEHFAGQASLGGIMDSLQQCSLELKVCDEVFQRLSERSPTALALTLHLLRANKGRPLEEVFHREALAAHFIIQHPDYLEGIRARIIDKDNRPQWRPATLAKADALGIKL